MLPLSWTHNLARFSGVSDMVWLWSLLSADVLDALGVLAGAAADDDDAASPPDTATFTWEYLVPLGGGVSEKWVVPFASTHL